MHPVTRMLLIAALVLSPVPRLLAQTTVDPSGHWEGTIQVPQMDVKIEIDLAKNSKGELAGTLGNPGEKLKGLPLANVAVDSRAVTFELKAGSGGGTFHGELLADGKSMSGSFVAQAGTVPFSLTRMGDAQIEAPPKSAPIGKEMEGTWNGAFDVDGVQMRVVLKMSNQPDGTSTGTIVSIDQGGIEVPVGIVQEAAKLTFSVKMTGGSYSGTLNAAGTELAGTYTTGQGVVRPLTFRRAAGSW
jgi:hypothetical protein